MIPKGLFTQLLLIIVSVAIVFTYIKPTFTSIGETQDKIVRYQAERGKVQEVNAELARQVALLENISASDNRKLLTYMPDHVDEMAVMRDLHTISNNAGTIFVDVTSGDLEKPTTRSSRQRTTETPAEDSDGKKLYQHTFVLTVDGSYNQIKNLVSTLERNEYPLEVKKLDIITNEGGFLSAELHIVTYSHLPPVETENLYE